MFMNVMWLFLIKKGEPYRFELLSIRYKEQIFAVYDLLYKWRKLFCITCLFLDFVLCLNLKSFVNICNLNEIFLAIQLKKHWFDFNV